MICIVLTTQERNRSRPGSRMERLHSHVNMLLIAHSTTGMHAPLVHYDATYDDTYLILAYLFAWW